MPRQLELVFFKNFGQTVATRTSTFARLFYSAAQREENQTIVSVLLPVHCAACARSVACESRFALSATRVRVMPAAAAEHSLHIHSLYIYFVFLRRNLALDRLHPALQCGFLLLASSSVHLHNGGVLCFCSSLLHS